MTKKRVERANDLFDILVDGDKNRGQVQRITGWSHKQFNQAVQALRDILGGGSANILSDNAITVLAEPQGPREQWSYGLRIGSDVVDPEQSKWAANRFSDIERRLWTLRNVLEVACNATDGRTVEGKKARIYRKHILRAFEDVGESE